jgi:hypothetical protein
MRSASSREALLAALLLLPVPAQAQEEQAGSSIDSEHIFGFTEGSDIGNKGEREIESATTGRLGRQGSFSVFTNETSFRYGVEQNFRASIGTLTDYYSVHDTPGLSNKTGIEFSGVVSEFRWHFLEHDTAPIGLTLSFAPYWRRSNDPAPGQGESYALPLALLIDKAFIPGRLYGAINVTVAPNFGRLSGRWEAKQPLEISAALTAAVDEKIFLGGEVREAARDQNGFFAGRALLIGPTFYLKLKQDLNFKLGWSVQVPEAFSGRMDLTNFERQQFVAQFAYAF